jgi:hypothetical protein
VTAQAAPISLRSPPRRRRTPAEQVQRVESLEAAILSFADEHIDDYEEPKRGDFLEQITQTPPGEDGRDGARRALLGGPGAADQMSSAAPLPKSVEEPVAVRVHRFAFCFEDDLVPVVPHSRPSCVYLTVDSSVIFVLLPKTSRILFGQ